MVAPRPIPLLDRRIGQISRPPPIFAADLQLSGACQNVCSFDRTARELPRRARSQPRWISHVRITTDWTSTVLLDREKYDSNAKLKSETLSSFLV